MARTLHWMTAEGARLTERRAREDFWETVGHVEEAPYLRRIEATWWRRLWGARPSAELVMPFDASGADVLSLFDEHVAELDDAIQVVRRARGRVACLAPRERGDDVVLRDLWSPRLRLLDALQFALEGPGMPVAVAFTQCPLVIGAPRPHTAGELLGAPGVSGAAAARVSDAVHALGDQPHPTLEIHEGDEVEILGLTWDPDRCERRFDLVGRMTNYRDREQPLRLVLGDAPGLRMVIRVLQRAR